MGLGSEFQKAKNKFVSANKKLARQTEDFLKTTYMGDPNGIEGFRQKQQQSGTDLGKLRADAVANGFNPLTVLRATGGQGFYKNEIPMGRLSSDAFFNTFDRIKQRNYNKLPVSDTSMDGMMYGAQVAQTTSPNTNAQPKLAFNNSPLYPVKPTEIENDFISTGTEFVANKTTALKRPMKLPDGRVIMVPFDPEDMDPMTVMMGYGALALSNFTNLFPEVRPIKAFKDFGKSIREKGEITRTKLPKQKDPMRYEQARKHGILSWITDTEKQF